MKERRPLTPELIEALSDALAAAVVADLRARAAEDPGDHTRQAAVRADEGADHGEGEA